MAERGPGRRSASDDMDDDQDLSYTAKSRREDYYSDQRSGRPSTGESSKSRGKRPIQRDSSDYDLPDVPPLNPNDWKTQHPPSQKSPRASRSTSYGKRRHDGGDTVRRRRSANPPQEGLTEMAAPQPVTRESRPTSHGRDRRDRLETTARRRRSGVQVDENLTEVAAPPPVSRHSSRKPNLEDAERDGDADADDEDEGPSLHSPRKPEDYIRRKKKPEVPSILTELYTISYLVFFSIFGTLARLGVQWIAFYPGTPVVTPVIWANFGGSLIMGFLVEDRNLFRIDPDPATSNGFPLQHRKLDGGKEYDLETLAKAEAMKRKKIIPLYIGLATGFCGSFTSFSSFARDMFLALSNNLPTPIDHRHRGITPSPSSTVNRNGGYGFEAWLQVVLSTLALSIGGLVVGAQLAAFLSTSTPRIHRRFVWNILDPAMVVLAVGCWLGAVFLAIWPPSDKWRGEVVFALVFAPPGCLIRYYASLKLNALVPAFPLGTFAVNMLGSAIEGMCFDIQHVRVGVMGRIGGGVIGCQILQGVQDGFCGCLTTVSTWAVEIEGLKRKHGWGYAFGSVMGGLCLMVIVMGSVRWSVGFSTPLCDTGYTSKVHG